MEDNRNLRNVDKNGHNNSNDSNNNSLYVPSRYFPHVDPLLEPTLT
jgi:hypothetical protein